MNLNWTTEAKVLLILGYYLILGAVVLTILTNSLNSVTEFRRELEKYFKCESFPKGNNTCDSHNIESLVNPIPTTIAFVVLGFYPVINLVFTINIKEIREKVCGEKRKVEVVSPANHYVPYMRGSIQSAQPPLSIYPLSRRSISSFESILAGQALIPSS